ncbi:MAG: adenylosuccinate lyase [Planctomycetaceae bacterium]
MSTKNPSTRDHYDNPLLTRYASAEMSRIWSPQAKHSTWRRLWVALAEAERELGLDISAEQIDELCCAVEKIDFDAAERYERQLRHDVMAHVHAYRDQCPRAGGIIHLGATSCYVTDNTELIQIRDSLELVRRRLVAVIDELARFAERHRDLPCLAFTHLQPAQPTTVGKRAALWCYDLVLDLEEIEHRLGRLKFRGVKGTTGTQASFLQLFSGDHQKVEALDRLVTQKMDFIDRYPVTGQTYSRKVDAQVLDALSGVAQSAHKAGTDVRILQHRKELEEPFGDEQIGSSAMAYKRNPMRAERMCSLARFAMSLAANAAQTTAVQWMERSLDDSANRRLSLPQACLAVDAVLILYRNIAEGLVVYPRVIERNLQAELPFMATEELLMAGVQAGGGRQELHERIRVHSMEAARRVKEDGLENDLLARLAADPAFAAVDVTAALEASRYVGRAPQQVEAFLSEVIAPIRQRYADDLRQTTEDVRV